MNNSLEKLRNQTGNNGLRTTNTSSSLASLRNNLPSNKGNNKTSLEQRMNNMAAQVLPEAKTMFYENKAEVVFIFDESGSCYGTEYATCQSYNKLLDKERKLGYPTKVTTILFDSDYHIVHDRMDIKNVGNLSYSADGATALYDTICYELSRIKNEQQKSDKEAAKKTVVVIMTDGMDNASGKSLEEAKEVIKQCKELGWEFIFLGANIDSKKVAASLGIDADHAQDYHCQADAIASNFDAIEIALKSKRLKGTITPNWKEPIQNTNLRLESGNERGKTLKLGGR